LRFTSAWLAGALLAGAASAQEAGPTDGGLRDCVAPSWRTLGTANEPRAVTLDVGDRVGDDVVVFAGELRVVFDFLPGSVRPDQLTYRLEGGPWNDFDAVVCENPDPCTNEAVAALDLDLVDFTDGAFDVGIAQTGGTPLPVREVCVSLAVSPPVAPADDGGGASGDEGGCEAVPGAPLALPAALLLLARRRRKR
jgi:uncharacterized protein (TIGR03382 family)